MVLSPHAQRARHLSQSTVFTKGKTVAPDVIVCAAVCPLMRSLSRQILTDQLKKEDIERKASTHFDGAFP